MIIIGGGIAGLSLGWQLAKRGQPVTLYEAGRIGRGASHAAAGYLQPALPPSPDVALEMASLAAFPAFIAEVESDTGLDTDFRRDGQLRIAYPGQESELFADAAARRNAGWQVDTLTGDEARSLEPALSPEIAAATFLPQVVWVDGRKLCAALAQGIRHHGGEVIENTPVTEITHENNRITGIRTARGHHPAERVALCAGHSFDRIKGLPAHMPASIPVRGVILTLGMPEPLITRLIKRPDGILCPRSDGRLIVGVTKVPGDMRPYPDAGSVLDLLSGAFRAAPALRGLPFIEAVHGFRPYLPDEAMLNGPDPEISGLFHALGHAADGYLRAAAVSEQVATAMVGSSKT